jgi:hypothetical protein
MVRVIEGAWVVVAAAYRNGARGGRFSVRRRCPCAVVVVIAEALVFERLPRHVDFVIVVLCVVLEGGRRFADRG